MAKNGKYKYWITTEGLTLIGGWAKDGLTNNQIAEKIGISKQTFYDWLKKYPDLSDSLKKGKEIVDRQVENALLKRALGYDYEEKTEITDDKGKKTLKVITKHVVGDTTAQIFWLKNRKPDKWRDKQEIEQVTHDESESVLAKLTDEELRKLIALDKPAQTGEKTK